MQNPHFISKIKIPKNLSKSILQSFKAVLWKKTATKNIKNSRNEIILKIDRSQCKDYSPCKILTLAQKLKFQKTCQKPFYKSFRCFVQKTAPKNTKYLRNESILKIGHHQCKGYSPCKFLPLAQKLKFRKTCQNPF